MLSDTPSVYALAAVALGVRFSRFAIFAEGDGRKIIAQHSAIKVSAKS
jgi:hypothetical protein